VYENKSKGHWRHTLEFCWVHRLVWRLGFNDRLIGELIHLSVAKLKFSPFKDFFIPGAILFVVLGWGSLLVLPFVLNGTPKATNFLILAGVTISGWIVVQMIMLLEINWLHILYLSIGMMLITVGFKSASKTVRS
jgi:hypothetical protein